MGHRDAILPNINQLVKQLKRFGLRNDAEFSSAGKDMGLAGELEYVCRVAYPKVDARTVKDNALLDEIAKRLNQTSNQQKNDWQQTTLDGVGFEPVIYAPPYFRDEDGMWQPRSKLSLAELLERSEVRRQRYAELANIARRQYEAIKAAYDAVVARGMDPEHVYCKPPEDWDEEDAPQDAEDAQ